MSVCPQVAYKVKSQKSEQEFLADAWYLIKKSNPKLDIFECDFAPVKKETVEIYSASVLCNVSYKVEVDTLAKVDEFVSLPSQRVDTGVREIHLSDLNSIAGDSKNRVCDEISALRKKKEKSTKAAQNSSIFTACNPSDYDISDKLHFTYQAEEVLRSSLAEEFRRSGSGSRIKVENFRLKSFNVDDIKYFASAVYIVEKYSTSITYDGVEIELYTYPCVENNIFVSFDEDSWPEECSNVLSLSSSASIGDGQLEKIAEPRIKKPVRDAKKDKQREEQLNLIRKTEEKTARLMFYLIVAECILGMAFLFIPGMWFVGILALVAIIPTYKLLPKYAESGKKVANARRRQAELLEEMDSDHKVYLESYFKSLEAAFEKKCIDLGIDCDSFKKLKNDTKTPEEKAIDTNAEVEETNKMDSSKFIDVALSGIKNKY